MWPGTLCCSAYTWTNNKIWRNYKRLKITVCVCVCVLITQSCPTLCEPIYYSPPGSSVHGILQARILEWLPFPFLGDLPDPGIKYGSPTLQADYLPSEPPEKPMKITVCAHNWSKLWKQDSKKDPQKTPQSATSEERRVKIGYCACPLHTPTKEMDKHPSYPSSPPTGPAPTVHIRNYLGEITREPITCFQSLLLR